MQYDELTPPGPGRWALDRSHFPGGTTPICQWLMEESMGAGLGRAFAELGVPADSVQARFVDGFMYTRLRPLLRPDAAGTKLPPAVVLRVATRVHPAFRRREKAAANSLRTRPWLEVASRWQSDIKPALEAQNRRFQAVDTDALDDADLARHVAELLEHCHIHAEMHFWLHGHDLGPIARYLYTCQRWGISAADALPALAGASPSTSEPLRQLVRLRALIDAAGVVPSSLDDIRAISPQAAALLDEYLAQRGQLIVTRYDIDGLTLGELPGIVLLSVLNATPAEVDGHEAATLALRARVPDGERALFDEVLGDARAVMDIRDDNGPLTVEWPAGLLRRALLTVGTRLATTGRIADAEHALELTPAEARVIMRTGTPTAADLSERAASAPARPG